MCIMKFSGSLEKMILDEKWPNKPNIDEIQFEKVHLNHGNVYFRMFIG